jgi:D-glycero-D-manno-heptose 1,7-bisphosphate phosphatase
VMEEKGSEAVFLDRDGTINEEVGYITRMEGLRLIPGVGAAIRRINERGLKVVVVTNQSGVARGLFDEAFVARMNARLSEMLLAEGALIDAFYFCPHHPTEGKGVYLRSCGCRKPEPGMVLKAAEELGIDRRRSYLVGDTLRDIGAAAGAGVRGVLVRTGYGEESAAALAKGGPESEMARPAHIAADLPAAVAWIMEDRRGRGR